MIDSEVPSIIETILPVELTSGIEQNISSSSVISGKTVFLINSVNFTGSAIANTLAKQGYNIAFQATSDNFENAVKISQDVKSRFAIKSTVYQADSCKESDICEAIGRAEADIGSVDILIYIPGESVGEIVELFPAEDWNSAILCNLSSAFFAAKAVIPAMKAKGWGRIINLVAQPQLIAQEKQAARTSALYGLIGLTKSIAVEIANDGVTANVISVGWLSDHSTNQHFQHMAEIKETSVAIETKAFLKEKQPLKKLVLPEQVASMVAFLCSEQADTITGTIIKIDGGASIPFF